ATEQDRAILEDRRHELGEQDPYTLSSASNYGRDLREIGELAGSRSLLENTLEAFRGVGGGDHPGSLRAAKDLAITLRKASANQLAHSVTAETLARYRKVYGPRHPEALACEMTLATTTAALGDDAAGVELAQTVLDKLQQALTESHLYLLS